MSNRIVRVVSGQTQNSVQNSNGYIKVSLTQRKQIESFLFNYLVGYVQKHISGRVVEATALSKIANAFIDSGELGGSDFLSKEVGINGEILYKKVRDKYSLFLNYLEASKSNSMNQEAPKKVEIHFPYLERTVNLPLKESTLKDENGEPVERFIDITRLGPETGRRTFDKGCANTATCESDITYIDGDKGILLYRGYPIEQLAQKSNFLEVCFLLLKGQLPSKDELAAFRKEVLGARAISAEVKQIITAMPKDRHPMAMLQSLIPMLATAKEASNDYDEQVKNFDKVSIKLLAQIPTLVAACYRHKQGLEFVDPDPSMLYSKNFLNMMFKGTQFEKNITDEAAEAMILAFMLHADHEQNCSTSTTRNIGSAGANLFASVTGGVGALWGPSHGGANMEVIAMLEDIYGDVQKLQKEKKLSLDEAMVPAIQKYIEDAESKESKRRLMGFGHRVYKNFDPRAKIIKQRADDLLKKLGIEDSPLLKIAKALEEKALKEEYFISRKLYPNVDFYSGIIFKAIGFSPEFFTTLFAVGRAPGWIAQWHENLLQKPPIYRPRQVYKGPVTRDYTGVSAKM